VAKSGLISLVSIKQKLRPYYVNVRGWRTARKIVVIESDDWGSIRMPSAKAYKKCLAAGFRVDENPYEKYDSLASNDDLELLFDLLSGYKDSCGKNPVITANSLVANPDFEKIRDSNFEHYFFEPISKTFDRYPMHDRCLELWREGLAGDLFFMQSHGREHLNVSKFMNALRREDPDALFGFNLQIPGGMSRDGSGTCNHYIEALIYDTEADKKLKLEIILEGLELFETAFGYRSESFIPPNYIWSPDFDENVSHRGVDFYQGNRKMKEPAENGLKLHTRTLGEKNRFGQTYLVRNAVFEPTLQKKKNKDPVQDCLRQINAAFLMNKPAIICSHRINYVGFLDTKNRDANLIQLKDLIDTIQRKWPDVEFMTSVQLGKLMAGEDD